MTAAPDGERNRGMVVASLVVTGVSRRRRMATVCSRPNGAVVAAQARTGSAPGDRGHVGAERGVAGVRNLNAVATALFGAVERGVGGGEGMVDF